MGGASEGHKGCVRDHVGDSTVKEMMRDNNITSTPYISVISNKLLLKY